MYTLRYNLDIFIVEFNGEKFIFETNSAHTINNNIFKLVQLTYMYCIFINQKPMYYFDKFAQFSVKINSDFEIINPNYDKVVIYSGMRHIPYTSGDIIKIGSAMYYNGAYVTSKSMIFIRHNQLCRPMCEIHTYDDTIIIGNSVYNADDAKIRLTIKDNNLHVHIKVINKIYQKRVYIEDI